MRIRAVLMSVCLVSLPAGAKSQTAPVFTELECIGYFYTPQIDICRAAARGDATAARRLGRALADGEGRGRDDAIAVRVFRQAAEAGSTAAAADLGQMYERGRGVPMDHAEAARWYRISVDGKNPLGMLRFSRYFHGSDEQARVAEKMIEEAVGLAEPLAEKGDPDALYVSSVTMVLDDDFRRGPRGDISKAIDRLRRAAQAGQTEAAAALGRFLVRGYPERLRNPREGVHWLEQAVARADADACSTLSGLYANGSDDARIPKDAVREARLDLCAAEQGNASAAYDLGKSSVNEVDRRRWYQRAAEWGHKEARTELIHMLLQGRGGPHDEAAALAHMRIVMAGRVDGAELAWIADTIARQRDPSREALQVALAAVEQAMKRRDPELWVEHLALVHLRLGDAARAEALLRAELARRGDPDNGDVVRHRTILGEALVALGRVPEAREQWQRAIRGGGSELELRYRLSELDRK